MIFGLGRLVGQQINHYLYPDAATALRKGKTINILFMGIDARDAKSNSRSDTMILASIDPKNKKVALISVPRDTRIVNDKKRSQKINEINLFKGPEDACKAVGNLLNVRVPYYVVTNFNGFVKIIDMLEGIDLEVEMDMVHPDPINPRLAINIKKGQQHLNGQQALNYVRFRGGATADIGRTQRQQKFIKAVIAKLTSGKNLVKLPQIIAEVSKNVNTNIGAKDMVYLTSIAGQLNSESINAQTLPGFSFTDPQSGASYWEADKKIAPIIVEGLLKGEKYKVASDSPIPPKKIHPPAEPEVEPENAENIAANENQAPNDDIDTSESIDNNNEKEPQNGTDSDKMPLENETENSDAKDNQTDVEAENTEPSPEGKINVEPQENKEETI